MHDAETGRRSMPALLPPAGCWRWLADEVRAFVAHEALDARRVVVLLPFAQHLPLARAAWTEAAEAAWMPRFETTQTLAASACGPTEETPGALSLDAVADRLRAARMLRESAPDWPRRDPRGFEQAVRQVVDTAQALARTRMARRPADRPAWIARARAALAGAGGPDERERALARLALEWSLGADSSAADALHELEPAGWVALRAGAAEPLTEALLAAARVPALWLDADRALADPPDAVVRVAACDDLEDEAQRSAAQVLEHLAGDERPVALIALDRVLLRRVRALLERQQVPISDETGWKLSTTRAGARVAALLRAAQPSASTDELLDCLKSSPLDGPRVDALESACRRAGASGVRQIDPARLDASAAALWQAWSVASEPLRTTRRAALADWLRRLEAALRGIGLWDALHADAAGAQVLAALRCTTAEPGTPLAARPVAMPADAADTPFDVAGFRRWVDDVLEQVAFAPPAPSVEGDAPVVVTPLARAMLRPFAAVVCPGADAAHLGAAPPAPPLLGDALAVALGLPGAAQRRAAEQQAFAQLLRAPRLTLLHRARDAAEPLQPSPLLLRLRLAATRAGRALGEAADGRVEHAVAPRPEPRPAPSATALLPESLDATAYEALRACPYRFFAQSMLRLREPEELDDVLDKRDYGSWLHAVLQDFHARRGETGDPDADAALLDAVAREQQRRLQREDADFLPYAAWFERLAPRYLAWLHAEEAGGARVHETELALQAAPQALVPLGVRLKGRLDRLDVRRREDGARVLRIVDYKTSSGASLRERLRDPAEDTQLPFYAALLAAARPGEAQDIEALYLALDDREGVAPLPHVDVQTSAEALLEGLAHDLARLRDGARLPALGEGSACDFCSARGLCRRDHWAEPTEAPS